MGALRQKMFEISYYMHTSYNDALELFPFEVDAVYDMLCKRKKEEADAREAALKERKQNAHNKPKPSKKRR